MSASGYIIIIIISVSFSLGPSCARKYPSGNIIIIFIIVLFFMVPVAQGSILLATLKPLTHKWELAMGKAVGLFTTISSKYILCFFTHPSVGHQYILSLLGSIVPNCEQCWEYTQPQSTLRDHLALPACQNTSQQVKLLSQKKFTHHGSDSCQEGSHENCLAQT